MKSMITGAEITMNGQYIKDLSFENPNAPQIFMDKNLTPDIGVSIDINASKLNENTYEVELVLNCNAKSTDKTMFIVELIYAGIFTIVIENESLIQETLFTDCPFLLFPYARKIISDSTKDGNFPPLYLDPVDFSALYQARKKDLMQNS